MPWTPPGRPAARSGRRLYSAHQIRRVTASLSACDGCPAVLLEPTDRDRCWRLGSGEGRVARSTAAELLGWLTGRDRDVRVIAPHGGLPAGAPMAVIGHRRLILGLTEP